MPANRIESRDNLRLKHVRRVRDGREPGQIYIEGVRLAEEAVRSGLGIVDGFYVTGFDDAERERELLMSLSRRCDDLFELPGRLFSSIADTKTAQGIILLCDRPASDRESFEQRINFGGQNLPLVVMLNEVNNPSNLGAVVRTAEAAGAAGLIVSKNSADAFSAKALRSAMGAAFRLPIWEDADVNAALEWARSEGFRTIAASGGGETDYLALDWKRPSLLILGSEAHGLSQELTTRADTTVRIAMTESVESLNLAVSAGVILFEARRQCAAIRG
ncbi:MAG TPA: RNA methyltransferase [Pyrinomonadaceae bacterium]